MKKILLIIFVLILFSCNKDSEATSSATWRDPGEIPPIAVEVLEVTRGKLINYVESSGTISGVKEAWIVTESQGEVKNKSVNLGNRVSKGESLIAIDRELQELNLELAYEQLLKSTADFEANSTAYKNGNISKSVYDQFRIAYLQSQTNYKLRSLELDKTTIKAPFDGEVALIDPSVVEGNYLSPGTRVIRIVDLSSYKIELSLGERQVALIEKGADVHIEVDAPGEELKFIGRVDAIGSGSDPTTGSFPVIITWDSNGTTGLKSGMTGRVKIATKDSLLTTLIPSTAIIQRDRVKGVFVDENGIAKMTPIEISESFGGMVVVKSGLPLGEKILISGLSSIGDGYKIVPTLTGETGEWE